MVIEKIKKQFNLSTLKGQKVRFGKGRGAKDGIITAVRGDDIHIEYGAGEKVKLPASEVRFNG